MRPFLLARSFCCAVLCTRVVIGAPPEEDDLVDDEPAVAEPWAPRIAAGRPFSVGLDVYGGLALLFTQGPDDRARAVGGGLLRLSYWYLQAGATLETSNEGQATALLAPEQERWIAAGGFAGVLVPFHHWVDIDSTLGLVSRTYSNGSRIYGEGNGFTEKGPSVTWRLGISARSGGVAGARVGAGFFGAADLVTHHPAWQRTYLNEGGGVETVTGTTPVGGVSFGFYVSAGLEVTPRTSR